MAISTAAADAETAGAVRWSFAGVVLDECALELRRDGKALQLERRPLEVLMFLLRHAGEVVTKDELAEHVWARPVMDDQAIAKAVLKLRTALGDSGQDIVRTVHGHGYRLVAPVRVEAHPSPAPLLRLNLKPGDNPPLRSLWKLEQSLGAGGYGEVWLARHDKTHEARVFKFAADGPALTALKREITLYRLIHDSLGERSDVVRLLDWNLETPPYFVESEHSPGGSLLQWAESQGGLAGIPLTTRLELIAQVADALAAVHRVGVLHKDLKPANVVIAEASDGSLRAKLSDFGSGRVLDERRLKELGITRLGFTRTIAMDVSSSGTPQYLAPEVFAGQPLTVRADIYALGVMLYQIAVADFAAPLAPGWERSIGDELLREDIALAADGNPERRLAEASELGRRLRGLEARRQERAMQSQAAEAAAALQKKLERMRTRRGWLIAVVGVLALGLASTLLFYFRLLTAQGQIQAALDDAQRQKSIAQTVDQFLQEDLLAAANPEKTGRKDMPVREVVDVAAARLPQRFLDQPLLQDSLRNTLGGVYQGLGDYSKARQQLTQAADSLQGLGPAAASELADVRLALAELLVVHEKKYQDARQLLQRILQAPAPDRDRKALQQNLTARALMDLLESQQSRSEQAARDFDALWSEVKAKLEPDSALALELGDWRVQVLRASQHSRTQALTAARENLTAHERKLGVRHPATLEARLNLVYMLQESQDKVEARESLGLAQQVRAQALEVFGPAHRTSIQAEQTMGRAYDILGDVQQAETLNRDVLEQYQRIFGEDGENAEEARSYLASVYYGEHRFADALVLYRKGYEIETAKYGEGNHEALNDGMLVGACLELMRRWPEAEAMQRKILALARQHLEPGDWLIGLQALDLGETLVAQGKREEAAKLAAEAEALFMKLYGPDHYRTRRAAQELAAWAGPP